MGNGASAVRKEVVGAYRPYAAFLLESLNESLDAASATELGEYFQVLDTSGDGLLDFDEFVSGMQKLMKQKGVSFSKELLELHFQLFDADANGKLSKQEAMLAFYNLFITTSTRCDACNTTISPWEDVGYCCKDCRRDLSCQNTPETWFDLCSSCHTREAAVCPQHPNSQIVPAATVPGRPGAAVHVLLAAPGLNDAPGAPEHSAPCLCCGESHTLVLSYLRPDLQDLHMRPFMVNDSDTGKPRFAGFVCEFCAMRVCSKHDRNCMLWDITAITPGLCTKPFDCGHKSNCPGQGSNPGLAQLEQQAAARCSAHCPTCKNKLDKAQKLWEPVLSASPNPPITPTAAPSSSFGLTTSSSTTASGIPQKPVVETCFCCQEQHFVSNMGKMVDPYLAEGAHMQQLPDGRWVCELCCTWMCTRCCTTSRHDASAVVIHSWSREWTCANKCKKKGSGGWQFDTDALNSKADESHRVHCQPCRNKMIHGRLTDMRQVSAQQRANKNAQRACKARTGAAIGGTLLSIGGTVIGALFGGG